MKTAKKIGRLLEIIIIKSLFAVIWLVVAPALVILSIPKTFVKNNINFTRRITRRPNKRK